MPLLSDAEHLARLVGFDTTSRNSNLPLADFLCGYLDRPGVRLAGPWGIDAGRIEPGLWADFAAIDLESPSLAGWTPETLLESILFGATEEVIAATCGAGEWQEHRTAAAPP